MKSTIFVLIVLIVVSLTGNAQADISKRTHHDIHHVTGSLILTAYINHLTGLNWCQSATIVFVLGLLWESFDYMTYKLQLKNDLFDYQEGFSKKDLIRNGLGISFSFPLKK